MPDTEKQNKTAVVCYCTLTDGKHPGMLGDMLYRVQEIFEDAGFGQIKQAFTAGTGFPFTLPFQEYPGGFRAKPEEREGGECFLENLVLSYGLFLNYKNTNKKDPNEQFYLILLKDGSYEYEEELEAVLKRYRLLKEEMDITVCCLSSEEEETWEKDFADACGEEALLMKL